MSGQNKAPGSDAPVRIGRYHSVVVDHKAMIVTFHSTAPSAEGQSELIRSTLKESEDARDRLAELWSGLGYAVTK